MASYTEEFKAEALAALTANDGNVSGTAKMLGIPESTMRRWAKGGVNDDVAEKYEVKKGELSDRLTEIAHKLLDAMPNAIDDANLREQATALGIVLDKAQLLQGKPTGINNTNVSGVTFYIPDNGRD